MIRAVLIGVTGRMGRAILKAASDSKAVRVVAAVAAANSPQLDHDAGELVGEQPLGVRITADLASVLAQADVAIDFSRAAAAAATLAACRAARKPLLIGTTGLPSTLESELTRAVKDIAVLVAPNTSLGVTVLLELARRAAAALPDDFDIQIIEAHHRTKQDAPSGTALALGEALGRPAGFAVVRAGDIVGEHSVLFAGQGEQLLLTHRATDRAIFARGALQAAAWLSRQAPGRYVMQNVIACKTTN